MIFFTTVYTFNCSSELGHMLAQFALDRYLNAIISLDEAESIEKMLIKEMSAICKGNPSLEPMEITTVRSGGIIVRIDACEKNKKDYSFCDNRPVSIILHKVYADRTQKGDQV